MLFKINIIFLNNPNVKYLHFRLSLKPAAVVPADREVWWARADR